MSNTSTTGLAVRTDIKALLAQDKYKGRIAELLKDRAPQFGAALVQVVGRSYSLQKCQPDSVIGAAITAACLDLSLDPNLGEAHLVPYGDKCQFQLGYKGLTQLSLRSGQYKRMGWKVVYAGELQKWDELTGELILDVTKKTSEDVVGYAAYFALINGFERASYWTKAEVEAHAKQYSQAFKAGKKDSPWFSDFDLMSLKTVLKDLLSKWGPKSIQMQTAMVRDQQVFTDVETASYLDNETEGAPEIKKPLFKKKPAEPPPESPPRSARALLSEWMDRNHFHFDDLMTVCEIHPHWSKAGELWTCFDDIAEADAALLLASVDTTKEGIIILK